MNQVALAITLVVAAGLPAPVEATTIPRPYKILQNGELIDRAQRVVLVQVDRFDPVEVPADHPRWQIGRYTMRVIENLKGDGPTEVEVIGVWDNNVDRRRVRTKWTDEEPPTPAQGDPLDSFDRDFDRHHDPVFWGDGDIGRENPVYYAGATYLMVLGNSVLFEWHPKAAEVIHGPADLWLDFVRSRIADSSHELDRSRLRPAAGDSFVRARGGVDPVDPAIVPTGAGVKADSGCVGQPDDHLFADPGELVDRAPRIVLAMLQGQFQSSQGEPVEAGLAKGNTTLRVVENLKGDGSDWIVVNAVPDHWRILPGLDFSGHRDARFWDDATVGGGYPVPELRGACLPAMSQPVIGFAYMHLVFFGPQHMKGYEVIRSDDDLWLDFVRNRIADPTYELGRSQLLDTSP